MTDIANINLPGLAGWMIRNSSGGLIGKISALLPDTNGSKARYLVVDLNTGGGGTDPGRQVLIPVGLAEIHPQEDEVVLPDVLPAQLSALPEYKPGELTPVVEAQIRSILLGTAVGDALTLTGDDFYRHHHFDERRLYAHRMANIPVPESSGYAAADDLLMDYDDAPATVTNHAAGPVTEPTGEQTDQSREEGGLDISKYTGPDSKASSQFGEGDVDTFRKTP